MSVLRVLLPLLVIGAGVLVAVLLFVSRPQTERARPVTSAVPVEVVVATPAPLPAIVEGTGAVEAARSVQIVPQITGEIAWTAPELVPGGRFAEGETLFRIDPTDYQLAASQERARIAQAQVELDLEQSRRDVAEREWELLLDEAPAADDALALREPQVRAAQRNLEAARSGLRSASLAVERSAIEAPFDAMVLDESVEQGQVVAPGAPVATLVGTEQFRVRVQVPVEELAFVDVPGFNAEQGSPAEVVQDLGGGRRVAREGRVLQLAGALDPQTRTAQLLVGIDEPLKGELPLLPGAFVEVQITGRPIPNAILLPREAIVEGERVWVVTGGQLEERAVVIAWGDEQQVAITGGLRPGEQVVVSPIARPIPGMAVDVREAR